MSDYPTFHCPACDCECPDWARNPDDPRCRLCHMPFEDYLDFLGPEYRREFGYEDSWAEILYERGEITLERLEEILSGLHEGQIEKSHIDRWQTNWKIEGF